MKNVSILVPESSVPQAIADPQYLFTAVNQFLIVSGKKPLFNVQLVGAKKEVKLTGGIFSVHTDKQLKDVKKTDLVFIPALFGDMTTAISKNMHRVKIEAAKRSFESSRKNINEVMFDVGYTDTKAFRTIFKKITGLTLLIIGINIINKPQVLNNVHSSIS